jgi:carboxyl-terminal processing protease
MQRKNLKYLIPILVGTIVVLSFKLLGPQEEKEQVIFSLIRDALTNVHLQPRPVDDELSIEVYENYLESMDYNKLFLTQEDLDTLYAYRLLLDDALNENNTAFFELSYTLVSAGIERSKNIYTELLQEPFDYTTVEYTWTDTESKSFAADQSALVNEWRKHLKWRIINRIHEKEQAQEEDIENGEKDDLKTFEEFEREAREKELELQNEWYSDLMDFTRLEWFGMYMNAYCEAFDPHTSYLAPQQNKDFELSMTGQFEGIGAQLKKEGDYITIERIIAGSACWRQGDLEAGDKIIAVAQGEEEPVDVVGYKISEGIKLIRGKKGTEVRLTVKKKDGSRMVIPIIRDVVELESTFARSVVLDGGIYDRKSAENKGRIGIKTGYIRLPKFYVDFYKSTNRNAADDIKAEIEKLKAEGVEGIVFDLRSNGGGSLQAAIEIAGLFTEKGPMVQVKNFQNGTRQKSNRGNKIYWDGPLVILVNEYSASASEIVSAALQDRGRALIVGPSKSTFGKGTVQNMFDFDRAVGGNLNSLKPLGAIKITTEKFYRINGGTTQLQGVIPDIILPGAYDEIAVGEKEYDNALAVDQVGRATYTFDNSWSVPFSRAKERSAERLANEGTYNVFKEYAEWIAKGKDNKRIPLNYTGYVAFQDSISAQSDLFKNINKAPDSLGVVALPDHLTMFETDSAQADIYHKWYKNLSRDLVLREGVKVVNDLVK